MLARAFRDKPIGFYIDVGAMDPVEGSVTKHFYDRGWWGINIEPDERFYRRLQKERPRDINLSVALGDKEETRTFYQFEPQGISTFHPQFRKYFEATGQKPSQRQVKLTTLEQLCLDYVETEVDFLKIDAEGWEGPILRGANWVHFRPRIMLIEATEPFSHVPRWSEWEPNILNAGYQFVYYDGLNRYYVRSEEPALQEAFAYPPNVLDDFTPCETVSALRQIDKLSAELSEARLWVGQFAQGQAADRLRIEGLIRERDAEHQRAEKLFQESEEERRRAEHLLYEREVEQAAS